MDVFTKAKRSEVMSRIRARDTAPELLVRRALHHAGLRYRLHRKDLPGRPDIVLPCLRLAVFVNGCFWHSHRSCKYAALPKTNSHYWRAKLTETRRRDARAIRALHSLGWDVEVLWECEIYGPRLDAFVLRTRRQRSAARSHDSPPPGL